MNNNCCIFLPNNCADLLITLVYILYIVYRNGCIVINYLIKALPVASVFPWYSLERLWPSGRSSLLGAQVGGWARCPGPGPRETWGASGSGCQVLGEDG